MCEYFYYQEQCAFSYCKTSSFSYSQRFSHGRDCRKTQLARIAIISSRRSHSSTYQDGILFGTNINFKNKPRNKQINISVDENLLHNSIQHTASQHNSNMIL